MKDNPQHTCHPALGRIDFINASRIPNLKLELMKSLRSLAVGLRWMAALVLGSTCVAQTSGLFFPKGTNLTSFVSISDGSLGSSEQQIMIATLQGLVARVSKDRR